MTSQLDIDLEIGQAKRIAQGFKTSPIARRFSARVMRWRPRPTHARELGLRRLRYLLRHTLLDISAYRTIGSEKSELMQPETLLRRFPVLKKADLRNRFADFVSNSRAVERLILTRTGGSTGDPVAHLKVWCDEQAAASALEQRLFQEYGLKCDDEILDLAPRVVSDSGQPRLTEPLVSLDPGPDRLLRWKLLSYRKRSYIDAVEEYCAALSRKISFVYGAPSRILTLMDFCSQSGYRLRPRAVITTFEQLTPTVRSCIAEAFQSPVISLYGTTETGICGWECREGRIHFEEDFVWPELLHLDTDSPVRPGSVGRIVITALASWLMPIVRYETGDLGTLQDGECSCGRTGPALSTFEGRLSVVFIDRNGAAVRPYFIMSRLDLGNVEEYQIILISEGLVRINVGKSKIDQAGLERVHLELIKSAGTLFNFQFVRNQPFYLTPSGKRNPFHTLVR